MKTLLIVLGPLVLFFVFLCIRTQTSVRQAQFLGGKSFSRLPDGFWRGDTSLPKGSWLGKRFDRESGTGINVFRDGERIPFKMYESHGIWDPKLTVTRVDYNIPENPFWLRPALDEVVEIAPGKLLGKIHYRIFPGSSITLGYFWQNEDSSINP